MNTDQATANKVEPVLDWTGERYIPTITGQVRYEHLHRYAVCQELVRDKTVLDIACGEGYGSALLAATAKRVTGVDIDARSVAHASEKYGDVDNLVYTQGSVEAIPLENGSVDVVVSFETIEHLSCHDEMLAEIKRVLKADGVLVISTPDKAAYGAVSESYNEYHVKELYTEEFRQLLVPLFKHVELLGQRMVTGSMLNPVQPERLAGSYDAWTSAAGTLPRRSTAALEDPVYIVALCSDAELSGLGSSLYIDRQDDLYGEQVRTLKWASEINEERTELLGALTEKNDALQEKHEALMEKSQALLEAEQQYQVLVSRQSSLKYMIRQTLKLVKQRIANKLSRPGVAAMGTTLVQSEAASVQAHTDANHQQRIEKEIENFANRTEVHDLPAVFHYWSNKYLLPKFNQLKIRGVHEFFADTAVKSIQRFEDPETICRIASMGSGNCDIEIATARELLKLGHGNFIIECIDLVPEMLDRGRQTAEESGLEKHFSFTCTDILSWSPQPGSLDMVIANQSLHHFVDLEALFDKIKIAIGDHGLFATMDVIGRNGHMRWPEAMDQIDQLWSQMPRRYKYNNLLRRFEDRYENWDCSSEGFEGIRAQDILPLLIERFNFQLFLGYGNLTDIFVDRAFGHNFDIDNAEDVAFIDKVGQLDEQLLESGEIKPTHIVAVMSNEASQCACYKHLTPEFSVRATH